jgi:glycosyltransferase involved in cell wall biosynthesis
MACGAPVIASRISALEEITGGAALFFDPKSVTELTLNILELLDSENAQREFANAGQRRAAEFSWERSAQQTQQVYAAAVSRFAEVQK